MSIRLPAAAHPAPDDLEAFALGRCTESDHRDVRVHVAGCESCREAVVASVAERPLIGDTRTSASADDRALAAILHRRGDGERVLLPNGDAAHRKRRVRRAPAFAAAAAVLLIGVATTVFSSRELTASDVSGELRFAPGLPAPGDSIHLEYRGARFGRAAELRVRALLRTANDESPEWAASYATVAALHRDRDDVYRGAFILPDSVVYGAFAVEDTAGAQVDTRGGRLWDLLVRDASTRPAFDAMRQQMRFHYWRVQEVSLAVGRELVKVHPEDPESTRLLLSYEARLAGPEGRAAVYRRYRPQFLATHGRLRDRAALPARVMETMWQYAAQLGEDSLAGYWARRVAAEHPRSPEGGIQRFFALPAEAGTDSRDSTLDRLWAELGPTSGENIAFNGFMIARTARDTAGLRRWGVRLEQVGLPWYYRSFVGYTMAETRGLEPEGADRLRAHLREFGRASELHRIVGESIEAYRQRMDVDRASALVALGHALAAMGRDVGALDTLERAVELAWEPTAYLKIAELRLRGGDTTAAARAAAYAAVDGSLPGEIAALRRGAGVSDSAWQALVADGRALQRRQLLERSIDRPLAARAVVKDASGRERDLEELVRGRPAVIAFWSRYCIGSLDQLRELQRGLAQLESQGARLVAITAEPPSPALTAWLKEQGYTFDVYHDFRGEAAAVLQPWGTPDNSVLDARGRLRFQRVSATDVVGRVEVLRSAPPASD